MYFVLTYCNNIQLSNRSNYNHIIILYTAGWHSGLYYYYYYCCRAPRYCLSGYVSDDKSLYHSFAHNKNESRATAQVSRCFGYHTQPLCDRMWRRRAVSVSFPTTIIIVYDCRYYFYVFTINCTVAPDTTRNSVFQYIISTRYIIICSRKPLVRGISIFCLPTYYNVETFVRSEHILYGMIRIEYYFVIRFLGVIKSTLHLLFPVLLLHVLLSRIVKTSEINPEPLTAACRALCVGHISFGAFLYTQKSPKANNGKYKILTVFDIFNTIKTI